MSPERKKPALITQAIQETTQAVEKSAVNKFVTGLLPLIEFGIAKRMIPELPEGFKDVFREKMKDENIIPTVVYSHQGHADLITIAVVSKLLTNLAKEVRGDQFKGFLLPVAASLRTGHQGLLLQEFLIQAERNYLPWYSVRLLDYVRPKDNIKYGMTPNRLIFMRMLLKGVENGYGISDLPEGSVQSGRLKDRRNGDAINGMQKINCENLNTIIQVAIRQDRIPLLIHVGSSGASRIVDSNLDHIREPKMTPKELFVLLKTLIGENPINAKLGMPIEYTNMAVDDLADFSGREIAKLLPEGERGVYA